MARPTNAERQRAYRDRVAARTESINRLHDLLQAAAKSGNPEAAQLIGATKAETLSKLAQDVERRFGVAA